jgi:hypothetical protein
MPTWAQFVTGVKGRFYAGTPNEDAVIRAVAEYVKAGILKEVDHDLEQSKSYLNSYGSSKLAVAGYASTSNFATIKAGVQQRITVDGARDSIGQYIDRLTKEAMDDLAGVTALWNNLLVDAAIDLQRLIPCYCLRQENTYISTTSGLTVDGFVTKVAAPGTKIRGVRFGLYYPPLAEGVAVEVGDLVTSNGRLYYCDTAGTLGVGQLDGGLLTTDGSEETIGSLVFSYYGMIELKPATPVAWSAREILRRNEGCSPSYTITPQGDTIWLYPAINEERQALIEWDGLKKTFANDDAVSFDEVAQAAAAAWIRAKLASGSMTEYQGFVRRAALDCAERALP